MHIVLYPIILKGGRNMNTEKTSLSLYDRATDLGASVMVKATNGAGKFLSTKVGKYSLGAAAALAMAGTTVFAADNGFTPEGLLSSIMSILKPGVIGMGSLDAVVGGIQLGVSFQNENPDGKTRGFQTLLGGAIIAAVGAIIPSSISLSSAASAAYVIPTMLPFLF